MLHTEDAMQQWLGHALVAASLLAPHAPGGAPIVWQLKGEIITSPSGNPLEGYLPVGANVRFLVTVNPAAPDLCSAAGAGFYMLPGAHVSVGGTDYAATRAYLEADNPEGNCSPGATGATIRMFFDIAPFSAVVIAWPRPGETLPSTPPESAQFWVSYDYPSPTVSGRVTRATAVTEPSTLLLLLPPLSVLITRRRRR
jgi:hypothetical protein